MPIFPMSIAGALHDLVDGVRAGEAVEHELALVLEVHVARALRQLLDDRRGEDLAAARLVGDPRREDHVLAVEVRLLADRLAGVQPDADADRPVGVRAELLVDLAVDRPGALHGPARAGEGDHEAVALRLDLIAAEA